MPSSPTRELHDRLLRSLQSSPARDVARLLPAGDRLDVDTFERRLLGAERRIVRIGGENGSGGTLEPDAGQVILLSARNGASFLVAAASLWKRGFVPLLADADLPRPEIAELVRAFRPAAVILDRRAEPEGGKSEDLGDSLPGLRAWVPARRPGKPPEPARIGDPGLGARAAVVRLTSGTTGRPRGVVLTVEQLLADARQITATMGIQAGDSMIAAIPLGHAYGFSHVFMLLVLQGTRPVLLEQPLPALLIEALSGPGPLVLPGTPYLFDLLLQAAGRKRFKGLRLALSAGAPLPESLSRAFKERFGLPIRTFYGASECGGIAFDRSKAGVLPDGAAGTPLEGVRLTIEPLPGGHGEGEGGTAGGAAGRIVVHSEAVADGYLPPEPGGPIAPGRYLTADLGRLAPDGGVMLEGRADRMINVGGRKVNPAEVEAVLRSVPGVREAVVFAIPDRQRGQAVCACVVAGRAVTRPALLAACAERLAAFKIPRHLELVNRIPVTARGKTDRQALPALIRRPGAAARPTAGRN